MASVHDKVKVIDTSNTKLNNFSKWAYDLKKEIKDGIAFVSSDEAYETYKDSNIKGEFRCPLCGNAVYLVMDRGKPSFRHYKIEKSSLVESDGPIHKIVKDKIALGGVKIPSITLGDLKSKQGNNFEVNARYKNEIIRDSRLELLRNVILECRPSGTHRIVDIFGIINNDKYIIEVTHTHGLDADKIKELENTGANVIEVVVHTKDDIIDRLDYKWVINDNLARNLYQLVWRFCKHSTVKEPINNSETGIIEYPVPCKANMEYMQVLMNNSDEPYDKVVKQISKCHCNSRVDCNSCPRYFGIDHDKNRKDYVQCLLVDKTDGSRDTIANIPQLAKVLRDILKKV